ncbi:DsbA family protein [Planococcus faecalis]|uniref:Dihydroneopterin aldolase n=1 Tax=Planococcus faecalis TaxID=1598147 RepID=A0ABM6IT63_9BACL|nr:DsbA family protein [Planococcus faecalis]AQU79525.1 dihydroneopterin aldolase [Planococcus faecalis]OHX51927.1 dihydroneopterin aldolase [Planococcus faecalis]
MKNKNNKSGMKLLVLLTTLAVIILVAIVIFTNQQETPAVETAEINTSGQPTLGEEEAPVTVVEFGDFKCPSCKVWGETVYSQLVEDYIDKGDVKFSYINVLFHGEESTLASLAAESVYQQSPEAYWDFHKALFAAQPEVNHDAAWVTPKKVLEVAVAYPSIDQTKLKEDMEQQATMDAVEIDTVLVEEAGVAQTPTIVINGQTVEDPFDYEAIKELIEQELTGKQ